MILSARLVTARLAELQASRDREELEYARLEERIKQLQDELRLRGRSLDMTHGRIAELEALLAADTRQNGHEDAAEQQHGRVGEHEEGQETIAHAFP